MRKKGVGFELTDEEDAEANDVRLCDVATGHGHLDHHDGEDPCQ